MSGVKVLKLLFLHGLPGVGKLTVGRELSRLTGYKLFHNHLVVDLVATLFEFGSPPFVELREKIWLDVFSQTVAEDLDGLIFTFALDRTVRRQFVDSTRHVVESSGGEILFVELTCSDEELERRIQDPSRGQYGKLNSFSQFRELEASGAFVDTGIPADKIVVDITKLSASDAAELIARSLG